MLEEQFRYATVEEILFSLKNIENDLDFWEIDIRSLFSSALSSYPSTITVIDNMQERMIIWNLVSEVLISFENFLIHSSLYKGRTGRVIMSARLAAITDISDYQIQKLLLGETSQSAKQVSNFTRKIEIIISFLLKVKAFLTKEETVALTKLEECILERGIQHKHSSTKAESRAFEIYLGFKMFNKFLKDNTHRSEVVANPHLSHAVEMINEGRSFSEIYEGFGIESVEGDLSEVTRGFIDAVLFVRSRREGGGYAFAKKILLSMINFDCDWSGSFVGETFNKEFNRILIMLYGYRPGDSRVSRHFSKIKAFISLLPRIHFHLLKQNLINANENNCSDFIESELKTISADKYLTKLGSRKSPAMMWLLKRSLGGVSNTDIRNELATSGLFEYSAETYCATGMGLIQTILLNFNTFLESLKNMEEKNTQLIKELVCFRRGSSIDSITLSFRQSLESKGFYNLFKPNEILEA